MKKHSKTSREEAWARLAERLDGTVTKNKRGKPERVIVPHGPHEIVLDSYTVSNGTTSSTYTRVRALFRWRIDLRCKIRKRNPLHALGALLGYRAIPISYRRFEAAFFVRGTEPERLRAMLQGTRVSQLLLSDPRIAFDVKRPGRRIGRAAGETVLEIHLQIAGTERDVERLVRMIELCSATLTELVRLSVATEEPVGVAL